MTDHAFAIPRRVTIADCWARDGLQNQPEFIPTEAKVSVIDALVDAGVDCFDACLGGLGGQPAGRQERYHSGETGNVCTEDLLHMLIEMGVETSCDLDAVLSAGRLAEAAVGRRLRSLVLTSGPVH